MDLLDCGHAAVVAPRMMCRHLLVPEGEIPHVRAFTGDGIAYDLWCLDCAEAGTADLIVACEGCVDRFVDDPWDWRGWHGEPEIRRRPEQIDATVTVSRLPFTPLDIAPLDAHPGQWLLLRSHEVVRWHAESGGEISRGRIRLPKVVGQGYFSGRPPVPRLHASPDGRFCAVVNDYDRHGAVFDLRTGRRTMHLDRGDYYPGTTPFPCAFITLDGRTLLVHGTAWNRLDMSDPATGELLTARDFPVEEGRRAPEHSLDYFHGRLHPSPDGRWIADDGWVWQPMGNTTVWATSAWLANPYESEDGDSYRRLCWRWDWILPMCWVGDRLAVSGLGDDEDQLPGVELFDPASGRGTGAFAGPTGELFASGDRLFSAAEGGLQIWDIGTGELLGEIPGFVPAHHHRGTDELAALSGAELLRWRHPGAGEPAGPTITTA